MPIALRRRFITNVPLRWVLTIPFVLLTVGATTLVGYLSYQSGQEAVENLEHQLVAQTNERVTQQLKISLQTPLLINRLNVGAVNQGQLDLQNIPALDSTLFNQLQQFDPVSSILFVSPQGTFRFVERYPTSYLGIADPPRPDQLRIYNLDSQGKRGQLVYVENHLDVRRDRPFYRRAVTTGKPGWNPISQYGSTEELTLDASQPVYDRLTKRLLGVFAVHIRLDYLSEFLQSLDISRFGQIIIMDQSGALVATSTREPLYKVEGTGINSQFKRLHIAESDNALTRSLGKYLRDRSGRLRSLDQTQYLEFRYKGEVQYVKIMPFQDQYGLNWRILTVIPNSHFTRSIQNNKGITALLCVLTLGGAIALGLFAGNRLIARFAQLNRASRELAAGNLDQRLPTDRSINELNSLAQTFNQMADQLQQSFKSLKTNLAASEEKFTIIFRSSPDLITLTTLAEGRCIEVNDNFLSSMEYTTEEVIGRRMEDLRVWDDLNVRTRFRETLQQEGSVHNLEILARTRTGHLKTLLLSAELIEISGEIYILGIGRDISDRVRIEAEHKQAEDALRQSETLNRLILNALPDLIIRMHRDGTYLDIKPTTAFPTGLPNFEVGQNIQNILSPEAAKQRLEAATTALQTREVQVYEFSLWVEGRHLWQEVRVIPLDTDEVLVVLRDLTQRNQMEEALRASEDRFRQLAETVREGFFVFETESSHYSYVNPAYEAIMATPFQTLYQGMFHWLNHIHPDDRDRIEEGLRRESQGENFDEEYRFIRPDGEIRWLRSKAFPLQNEIGTVVRVVGTVEDIHDHKVAELALKRAEDRYSRATRAAKVGVWEWNLRTDEFYLDPNLKALLGYADAEIRNEIEHWIMLVHPDDRPLVIAAARDHLNGITPEYVFEHRMIHKDGSIVWMLVQGQLLKDQYGALERLIGTNTDITEAKHRETERHQAEAALQQSEERFREIAHTINQLFFVRSVATGEYLYISPAYEKLWGYSLESLYQSPDSWLDSVYPEDREYVIQFGQQKVHTSQAQHEYRIIRADGAVRWISTEISVVRDEDGTPLRFVGLVEDISDRKQSEAALQESEERFQEIAQTINHVVYVISVATGQYLYISLAYEKLWGYSCESLYQNPKSWLDRIHPEDLEGVLQVMSQLFSGNQMQMEYRIICANGEVRWVRSESLIVPDADGNPLRIVGLAEDINDRKQVEAALQESEERFRRAFDGAPIGISLVTPTGQFVKVNPFYCDLVGYTEAELLTLTFQDITHPADLETDVEAFQQMMAGEIRSFQMEKRYITKQGAVVPVIINTAPIRDQSGQMLYCVGHTQDVRDRLKVERMKDEFISVISHELRTPLTSIRGALGILETGVLSDRPEKAQHMLQIAINNSDRLVRLVDDILKLERLESGKVQLIMEQCQATDLMQQAINSVQGLADQTGITLSLTPLSATLSAAPDAITQTLTNLLSNALKFSVSGNMVWLKAEILIGQQEIENGASNSSARSFLLPSPCILFTVKDQGRGIPQGKLELIFEQFQQVDVTDSHKKGGTGLGLAICKKIVQQHSGQIWAESNLGEGSTFYFALPLSREVENS